MAMAHEEHPMRTISMQVSEIAQVTRDMARAALVAAGDNPNEAIANLLASGPAGVSAIAELTLPESELAEFGGVTRAQAREFLELAGNDLRTAKEMLLAELIRDSSPPRQLSALQRTSGGGQECKICLDTIDTADGEFGGIMLRGCEHSFHRTCVAMYCKAEMDGGKTRLMCPLPECRRELAQRETRAIIGTENFAKLDRLALEEAVMADPTLHLCASPDCTFVASWAGPDDGLPRVVCPKCDTVRCLMCGRKWHGLEVSCAEASAAVPAAAAEALTMAYLKRTNVRRCARCGNGVVKSAGCNKMKCRCDYRFCYECGAENCTTAEGVNCGCTPAAHGYIDNVLGRGDFSGLAPAARPAHPS
eukprot:m.133828 g.133828  ORF g.133828 m.133828 type:complete len:362 (+) comp22501_c1_seq7:538-1623(+)